MMAESEQTWGMVGFEIRMVDHSNMKPMLAEQRTMRLAATSLSWMVSCMAVSKQQELLQDCKLHVDHSSTDHIGIVWLNCSMWGEEPDLADRCVWWLEARMRARY